MTDNTEAPQGGETPAIRVATHSDRDALARIAVLDGREIGESPLLVAECGGAIVAALSVKDGSVVADPFRYTLEAVAMLRARAGSPDAGRAPRGAVGARFLTRPAMIVAAALSAILVTVAGANAAAKPGLPAGTWIGSGSASGNDTQSGIPSRFAAKLRFRIVVSANSRVSGTGTFTSAMIVGGDIPSRLASRAAVRFSGTATTPAYSGTLETRGTFAGVTKTLKPILLRQHLPISRAGACKASGTFAFNGVSFRWTAARKIDGTCRT